MSFIVRDRLSVAVARLNHLHSIFRKFDRLWGKSGDELYYDKKLYFYRRSWSPHLREDEPFKKFLNKIGGSYTDLEDQDYNEIEDVWFELNQPKSFTDDYTKEQIADDFYYTGTDFEITVKYGGLLKRVIQSENDTYYEVTEDGIVETEPLDLIAIRNDIMTNIRSYLFVDSPDATADSDFLSSTKTYVDGISISSDITKTTNSSIPAVIISSTSQYGFYALFDEDNAFTQISISDPVVWGIPETGSNVLLKEISFIVRYSSDRNLLETDTCIDIMYTEFKNAIDNRPKYDNTVFSPLPMATLLKDHTERYPEGDTTLWSGGKLVVAEAKLMKRGDFIKLFEESIDTDYEPEEAEWWEVLLAIVIVILSIILAVISYGAAVGSLGTVGAWAAAFGAAAMTLSIGSGILALVGGLSAMSTVKIIAKVAQYVGILATILGIYATIQKLIQEAARKIALEGGRIAGNEAMTSAIYESIDVTLSDVMEVVYDKITEALGFGTQFTMEKVSNWLDIGMKIYKNVAQNEAQDDKSEAEKLEDELEQMKKENEDAAASKLEILGQEYFTFSMGSFDAIAELDKKILLSMGEVEAMTDPTSKIT